MKATPLVLRTMLLPFALLALVGCEEEPVKQTERIRAIKPYHVTEPAGGDVRRYSGTVKAANTSDLSFAVSGTVKSVLVDIGVRVKKGSVLATLDPKSYQLDVQAAQAELASVQAAYNNAKSDLARKQELYNKKWVAKAALDQAVSAFQGAEGTLNLARSRLGLAERDFANTSLRAPFDGIISVRSIDSFKEVSKGSSAFKIDSEGALEVEISIPDSVIGRLSIGSSVTVESGAVPSCGCTGRITEIGSEAGAANAVPVKAAILDGQLGILPGMSVEVSVQLSNTREFRGFMVPLVAIAPGGTNSQGFIFKYDKAAGVVKKVVVKGADTAIGNLIAIVEGVQGGDIIAAAGVSFLRDGQRVKLLGE
jgi:multidrug efflux system membrane fusion protein